ncbi:histone-like nucleoid-structuring protein Lsr2 [Pseudonocardia alni]|uniref:histone-like nucleoid-structuring protein Lsr2 n=1 Tax=Pseudonocardia alni TaxID=33907 RepID=UPI00280AA094|nr:Lsr2 family protein [Pseudonocardia alni]
MTQVWTTRLVDDIDGSSADETIEFAIDGKQYEIDLNAAHARRLRGLLADYASVARRRPPATLRRGRPPAGTATAQPTDAASREQNRAIRNWARQHGMSVSDRGRIPQKVLDAFHE